MTQTFNHIIVVFRNDDISALSDVDHERQVAAIFEQYGIPQTLGVIPLRAADSSHNPKGKRLAPLVTNQGIVSFLQDYVGRSGSEIALHGYTHRTNRLSRPSKREYFEFKQIPLSEQKELIRKGTEIIEDVLKRRPEIFIPPWNRLDSNTLLACKENGYKIVSAGQFVPSLDGLLSFGTDCDIDSFPILLREAQSGGRKVFLRILYHSRSINSQEQLKKLKRAIQLAATTPGCEVLTIGEAVNRYPTEIHMINEAAKNIVGQEQIPGSVMAQALIYRKVFRSLPQSKGLDRAYKTAKNSYYKGNYDEVCSSSMLIEKQNRKVLFAGRAIISIASFAISVLVTSVISQVASTHKFSGYLGAMLLALAIWIGIWHYATSSDTRREIRLAGFLSLVSGGIGMILFYALRHFRN